MTAGVPSGQQDLEFYNQFTSLKKKKEKKTRGRLHLSGIQKGNSLDQTCLTLT